MVPIRCEFCGREVLRKKAELDEARYCSLRCHGLAERRSQLVICLGCGKEFEKRRCQIRKSPNHFCSRHCAAVYHNAHRKLWIRRPKLEVWLEEQLRIIYPKLQLSFNNREVVSLELDIYVPALKLAFELNGIFHYEPIHGAGKLEQIQTNDNRKFQACLERGIELCIIDTSGLKYFKPTRAQVFLDIICDLVNRKMSNSG